MRINILPIETLSSVHLRAEFREIIMSIHYYKRSSRSKNGIDESRISKRYTLNGGHAYFWYNKYGYILDRYWKLRDEMIKRNYKVQDAEVFLEPFNEFIPKSVINDYTPDNEEMIVNLERVLRRIYIKPKLYKERTFIEWCVYYFEYLNITEERMYNMIVEIESDFEKSLLTEHIKD